MAAEYLTALPKETLLAEELAKTQKMLELRLNVFGNKDKKKQCLCEVFNKPSEIITHPLYTVQFEVHGDNHHKAITSCFVVLRRIPRD